VLLTICSLLHNIQILGFLDFLFFDFLIITGDFDSVTHVELKVIERKSTSISQHKDIIHNPDKNPSIVRSSETDRVSPKSG
jgi:hypothetical protein